MSVDNIVLLILVATLTLIYAGVVVDHINRDGFIPVVLASSFIYIAGMWGVTEIRENLYDTVDWCIPYIEESEEPREDELYPRIEIMKIVGERHGTGRYT